MTDVKMKRTTVDLPYSLYKELMAEGINQDIFAWKHIAIAALELWLAVKQGKLQIFNVLDSNAFDNFPEEQEK